MSQSEKEHVTQNVTIGSHSNCIYESYSTLSFHSGVGHISIFLYLYIMYLNPNAVLNLLHIQIHKDRINLNKILIYKGICHQSRKKEYIFL